MEIVLDVPPNFAAIDAAFKVKNKPVFFTYGPKIYNPMRQNIPAAIMVHEAVHASRQGATPDVWWNKYIDDIQFRLDEELPAHRAEFHWHKFHGAATVRVKGWRSALDYNLHYIASRLSGPLYGNMIKLHEAKKLIAS